MDLRIGNNAVDKVYIGTQPVSRIYQGTSLVWQASVAPAVAMPDVTDAGEGETGTVYSGVSLNGDGTFLTLGGMDVGPNSGSWLTAGVAADVEVYATYNITSGSASGYGTFNTWVPLTSGAEFGISRATNGAGAGSVSLTFRNKNTLVQLDTATIGVSVYRGVPI